MKKATKPRHPGAILRDDYIVPTEGLNVSTLAVQIGVPTTRLHEIVHERRGITADTAVRLASYFKTTAPEWMARQAAYDIAIAETSVRHL